MMYKGAQMKYVIKSVPSDNPKALENLLNEMSQAGWELYSMHEVEADEGFQFNCIFATENSKEASEEDDEILNINAFKSQMEKMLSSTSSVYDSCKEIQEKIKEQRKKVAKIKTQLEAQSETPISKNRKHLNEEISKGLRELEELRQSLIKTISPEYMYSKIGQEKLSINLSDEIISLVDPDLGGVLISETVKSREKFTNSLGYVIPKVMFADDENLNPYEFSIKIRGQEVINSYAYPGYFMFFEQELNLDKKIKGAIYSIDEISGKKIVWIEEKQTKSFWNNGLSAAEFISRLLEDTVIRNIEELLDYEDVNNYVEIVGQKNLFLVENIVSDFISVPELRYLLVNLVREGVSIKDIVFIFEKINDFSDMSSKENLLDKIRLTLSRYICKKLANPLGVIQVFEFSEKTVKSFFKEVDTEADVVKVDGERIKTLVNKLVKKSKENNFGLDEIIVLTSIDIRQMVFAILSQLLPNVKVVAREEIANEYAIEIIDEI